MKYVKMLYQSLKELPTKYPAVISAYIIYGYLFFVMIRFFIMAKRSTMEFYDVVEIFDALPFMWLLALTLVKVIDIKTKLHESETHRLLNEKELQLKETQINTMRQVVLGLQHQINNPLAIISLSLHRVQRVEKLSPEVQMHITQIEEESNRITKALKDFSTTQKYEIEKIGNVLGSMAVPGKSE